MENPHTSPPNAEHNPPTGLTCPTTPPNNRLRQRLLVLSALQKCETRLTKAARPPSMKPLRQAIREIEEYIEKKREVDASDWVQWHRRIFRWIQAVDNRVHDTETPPTPPSSVASIERDHEVLSQADDPKKFRWPIHPSLPLSRVYFRADFQAHNSYPSVEDHNAMKLMTPSEIQHLKSYWATHLPMSGRILDFCSSGLSHFPECYRPQVLMGHLSITMCGPHPDLLVKPGWGDEIPIYMDFQNSPHTWSFLNALVGGSPDIWGFDAIINVLNAHCLQYPLEFFGGLWFLTKPGGCIYLVTAKSSAIDIPFSTRAGKKCGTGIDKAMMLCDWLRLAG